jgi:hypothetical protein
MSSKKKQGNIKPQSQLAKEETRKRGNEEEKKRKEKGKWCQWEIPL